MPGFLPRNIWYDWPEDAFDLPTEEVIKIYESGGVGAEDDPDARDQFKSMMAYPVGEDAAHIFNLADTGVGKLVIPFVHALEMFPGCWPGAVGQGRGDCVSWGTRNSSLLTMVCDIVSGQPDEKTGQPEEKPEVPEEGIRHGVLSTETFYWYRGYNGDGWSCPAAANVATQKSGLMIRKDYTQEFGINLTKYSAKTAGAYGSRAPTDAIRQLGQQHLIHTGTRISTPEATRDFLWNGYGILDCGGEGYSSTRDQYGVSKQRGSWSHSMTEIGFDDRDVIKAIFNEPLVLILNSWAVFNSGPRDIYQSASLVPPNKKALWETLGIVNKTTGNIMIPEGSFWTPWSQARRRERIAMSGAKGWPAKNIDFFV